MGLIAVFNGVFNLLPFGGFNGASVLGILFERIVGKRRSEPLIIRYFILTLVLTFAICGRIVYADVIWFFSK